jgi:5-hydroxyisourate hydrolase-like protein (transthyretin family)
MMCPTRTQKQRWLLIGCVFALWAVCAEHVSISAQTATASGGRVISGTVLSAASGQPLEGADVTLNDAKTGTLVAETNTNADGRFLFSRLADGKYSLRATHRGYLAAAFDEHDGFSTAIVTGEGLVSTGLRFTVQPLAVLYGVITDDSGDPVQQARVSLYRQDERSGTGKIVRASAVVSDDLGNYEFPRLAPGNYYIAVTAQPWYAVGSRTLIGQENDTSGEKPRSPLDVAYPTTFYADVTDSDSATPIPVKAGDRIPVNFTMHAVPAVHISMQIPSPERGQFPIPQLRQEVFGSMEAGGMQGATYMPRNDGKTASGMTTVELSGVAPGHYELEVQSPRGEAGRVMSVDASSDHQVVDIGGGETAVNVTGKVAMAGGGNLPAGLSIALAPQQGDGNTSVRVDKDGGFEISNVRPGTYEVIPTASDAAVAISQATAAGATIEKHMLKVGNAPVSLAATLVESSGSVSGFAKDDGKPAAGVMILLVPVNPSGNRELFRRDQSDSDGSFALKRVIPGEYMVVAIADGWTLDWARPEVIGHYLPGGLKVSVPANTKDIQLKDAVQVQLK